MNTKPTRRPARRKLNTRKVLVRLGATPRPPMTSPGPQGESSDGPGPPKALGRHGGEGRTHRAPPGTAKPSQMRPFGNINTIARRPPKRRRVQVTDASKAVTSTGKPWHHRVLFGASGRPVGDRQTKMEQKMHFSAVPAMAKDPPRRVSPSQPCSTTSRHSDTNDQTGRRGGSGPAKMYSKERGSYFNFWRFFIIFPFSKAFCFSFFICFVLSSSFKFSSQSSLRRAPPPVLSLMAPTPRLLIAAAVAA